MITQYLWYKYCNFPQASECVMRKKFLETKASRKRFVVRAIVFTSLLALAAIIIVALMDPSSLKIGQDGLIVPSQYWWVSVARIVVMAVSMLLIVCIVLLILLIGSYFMLADNTNEGSLRFLSVRYNTFCSKLEEDVFPAIGRIFTFPFRLSSRKIRGWIDSGHD